MSRLRKLLGIEDDIDTFHKYIIESYFEYNAPLPEDIINVIKNTD